MNQQALRVAIVGPGAIGSTVAFHLVRAGHDVTVVARGARLERLRADAAIVTASGERAPVRVAAELDVTAEWDLVLVTVLGSQVDAVLPALAACAAHTVMFMFNTFGSLERLRAAVGPGRAAFGFPSIVASLSDGVLTSTVLHRPASTVSDPRWAAVLSDAGIPAGVSPDMQSWLRTHAAVIVPVLLAGQRAHRRGRGLSMAEAAAFGRALREGLALVRRLGNRPTPTPFGLVAHLPVAVLGFLLWAATRLPAFVATAAVAPSAEPAMLIDEMLAAAPAGLPAMAAVRA